MVITHSGRHVVPSPINAIRKALGLRAEVES